MKQLKITVNGKSYDVLVEETTGGIPVAPAAVAAAPVAVAAAPVAVAAAPVASSGDPISAPMPGTIVKVQVTAGQAVTKGQVLLVLEAMKMENEICAPKDGTIGAVSVAAGESVDSGKVLLTIA